MNSQVIGLLIRDQRLKLDLSQEYLCHGICAPSYLSKIEQGKTEASPDILGLLYQRLGMPWPKEDKQHEAEKLVEKLYEHLFGGDFDGFYELKDQFRQLRPAIFSGPTAADGLVLEQMLEGTWEPLKPELEACLEPRQLALQRVTQGRYSEAIALLPEAVIYYFAGYREYEKGGSQGLAIEYLQRAYTLASARGAPWLMLYSSVYMGNCYGNNLELHNMDRHFKTARRLAEALGAKDLLGDIEYNDAASRLAAGEYARAYEYFAAQEQSSRMQLHKLAVCCEKLGRREEALAALDKADAHEDKFPPPAIAARMCRIVRMRLEDADYLKSDVYGQELLECFDECRRELPAGYAAFHMPWVLEWYSAHRQYKQAYELVRDFPYKI